MKLKEGNPNLHDTTRRLAGDKRREVEGGTLYSDQEVDDAINLAVDEVWNFGKKQDQGWGRALQYRNSVTDQIWYDLPSTLNTQLTSVEIEPDGKNLNTGSELSPRQLKKGSFEREWHLYQSGKLTESEFWILRVNSGVQQYGIVSPPETGGTDAIRLVFEIEQSRLEKDADEPLIPSDHRELICLVAAESLRMGVDMDVLDIRQKMARSFPSYIEDLGDRTWSEPDFQPQCVGLSVEQNFLTKHGRAIRGNS